MLSRIVQGGSLSRDEAALVMDEVLSGVAPTTQLAALLCVMRSRRETVEELSGFAQAMAEAATPIEGFTAADRSSLVDTCGTGGDRSGTINVSTTAALVVAGAGAPVCKHGNRAASSQTGSADVLEALGVQVDLDPDRVVECIRTAGMGFCFARRYHPAMRFAAPVRAELGVPTAFNLLGPLVNPARLQRQVVGVSDPTVAATMLGVLQRQGAVHAMVVYGHDGLDELTTTTTSTVLELRDGEVINYDIDPAKFAMAYSSSAELKGGAPAENAESVRRVVNGEAGAQRDIVVLNAAAALVVGGKADSFGDAVELARSAIDSGAAATALTRLIEASNAA